MNIFNYIADAPWAFFSGLLATVILFWVLRGIVPMAVIAWREPRRLPRHFAAMAVLLVLGSAGRTLYWEGLAAFAGDENWTNFASPWRSSLISMFFNVLLIWGAVHFLRVLHLLIPEQERDQWSIWSAPCWPSTSVWPFMHELREFWKERKK